ncbi:glycosyltransferase family 4 protein [Cohnella hashimotonis]|uniref:Glycosyltransferase family 1 protein n=1 Tax=Cohnella hashimotonis TaxID=2826895 RepID=A0ABT6TTY4_9BACL|nr:glycosyltransferase family 1 protein [Cohnella hashimotonis]MDI4650331.1 glycosyltransferase family 1 protein [Cohnella hashimotonis]
MKIVYDFNVFSFQRYGGISRYFYELIQRVSRDNDAEVSAFLGFHINQYGLEDYKEYMSNYFGIMRPMLPKSYKAFLLLNEMLFSRHLQHNKFDIYHQTYYSRKNHRTKAAKILTVHDMIHEKFPEYFSENDNTTNQKKISIKNADGIICISESTKKDLVDMYNVPQEKIKVIYHGNSLKKEVKNQRIVAAPYILYVGDRKGYKNFKLLLQAYVSNSMTRDNYHIVCFGGGEFSKEEREYLSTNNIINKVHHYGGSDDTLSNLYYFASLFVYPSLYEGFGIPPLEAMYYGCPVLASDKSSIPEIMGEAGLYFDPYSLEDMSDKLSISLENTDLRNKLITKGYEQEKKYSWDRCSSETIEFYREFHNR